MAAAVLALKRNGKRQGLAAEKNFLRGFAPDPKGKKKKRLKGNNFPGATKPEEGAPAVVWLVAVAIRAPKIPRVDAPRTATHHPRAPQNGACWVG